MNGLSLLITADDWPKYRNMYAGAVGFSASQVDWGDGPATYPCLVASYTEKSSVLLNAKKVVSAYVYVTDAQKLLDTAGMVETVTRATGSEGQGTFNKALMAHMMVIIELAVDTGLVKEDQYEKRFAAMLSKTDQMNAEDLEKAWRTDVADEPDKEDDDPMPDMSGDDDDDDEEYEEDDHE